MKVLIADDSEVVVQRLAAMLVEMDGIDVIGRAGTVASVSHAIRSLEPDVVILDMHMPGGSGFDVLEGMKTDRRVPVVIVLTNHSSPQYRDRCLQNGARFFFDKSTAFERVWEVLGSLLRDGSRPTGSAGEAPE